MKKQGMFIKIIKKIDLIFSFIILIAAIIVIPYLFSTKTWDFFNSLDKEAYNVIMTLVISIFGSAIGFSLKTIIPWFCKKLQYWRLKLQGEYYTEYQDYENGKHVIIKERVSIKKFGSKLYWRSNYKNRSWDFEGKIEGNLLKGEYLPCSVLDSGKGSFLLQIDFDNTLLGIWMGFSHNRQLVSQGLYYFKKVPEITLMNYNPKKMKTRVTQIISGTSLESATKNLELIKEYEKPNVRVRVAVNKDLEKQTKNENPSNECISYNSTSIINNASIIGATIWSAETPTDIAKFIKIPEKWFPLHIKNAKKVAMVSFLGIDKKYADQGIESKLVKDMLNELQTEKENYDIVMVFLEEKHEKQDAFLLDLINKNLLYESSGKRHKSKHNHIKGSINSESNPVVYGYGFSEELINNGFERVLRFNRNPN